MFQRRMPLPDGVDADGIAMRSEMGCLPLQNRKRRVCKKKKKSQTVFQYSVFCKQLGCMCDVKLRGEMSKYFMSKHY